MAERRQVTGLFFEQYNYRPPVKQSSPRPTDFEWLEQKGFMEPYIEREIPREVLEQTASALIDDYIVGAPIEGSVRDLLGKTSGFLMRPEFFQHFSLRALGVNSSDQVGKYIASGHPAVGQAVHHGENVLGNTFPTARPIITLKRIEQDPSGSLAVIAASHELVHALAVKDGMVSGLIVPGRREFQGMNEAFTNLIAFSTYVKEFEDIVDPEFNDFARLVNVPYGQQMIAVLRAIRLSDLGSSPMEAGDLADHYFDQERDGVSLMEDLIDRIPEEHLVKPEVKDMLVRAVLIR